MTCQESGVVSSGALARPLETEVISKGEMRSDQVLNCILSIFEDALLVQR